MYNEDQQQLDLRLMKTFRFGKMRLQGLLDLYNALNASTVTTINQSYRRELAQAAGDRERTLPAIRRPARFLRRVRRLECNAR